MKTILFSQGFKWFLLNATLLLLAAGCATQEQSYNSDYSQHFASAPTYVIEDQGDSRFKITLHQGSPLKGPERIIQMKSAADTIAGAEANRRGWKGWNLNYIQERDKGWMHILVAEVTRQTPPEYQGNKP